MKKAQDTYGVGLAIALGIIFGLMIDNIGLGIALGAAFGLLFGFSISKQEKAPE